MGRIDHDIARIRRCRSLDEEALDRIANAIETLSSTVDALREQLIDARRRLRYLEHHQPSSGAGWGGK